MAESGLIRFIGRAAMPQFSVERFDPDILAPEALKAAQIVWTRRVINEGASIEVARRLRLTASAVAGVPELLLQAFARLEVDEHAHHQLSEQVVMHLGAAIPSVPLLPPLRAESAEVSLARQVLGALCVCETVSAARYAAVRTHTDLDLPRVWIEALLRDEVAHGELGFIVLPWVLERLGEGAREVAADELRLTFRELDRTVGLDSERKGGPEQPRPQPLTNPGVVEPAVDAWAFYDAIRRSLLPRLETMGLPAREAWLSRWKRL